MGSWNFEDHIGALLRAYRESRGFSQIQVAQGAGLSVRHYQGIEYGKTSCKVSTLGKILRVYGRDLFSFLDDFLELELSQQRHFDNSSSPLTGIIFRCRLDLKGALLDMKFLGPQFLATEKDDRGVSLWDLIVEPNEKSFVQEIFRIIVERRPRPFPLKLQIKVPKGPPTHVRAYWNYQTTDEGAMESICMIGWLIDQSHV